MSEEDDAPRRPDGRPRPPAGPPARPRRSLLRAWAEVRGLLGEHTSARHELSLTTTDGVALAATMLPGPDANGDGPGPAVVLLHGFAAHRRKPRYAWLADELATRLTVLAVDLRGHGGSGGSSGLGATESPDVAAAVGALRDRGHPWVAVVGVSMGATSAANAVADGVEVDALALVSGPGWIELRPTTAPMRRMRRLWRSPAGRAALRAIVGVRVDGPRRWSPPHDPADVTDDLTVPLLVVHGSDDEWFGADHAQALVSGAHEGRLWLEPRFGHAEDGFRDPFGRRLATALLDARRTGGFPARETLPW